MPIGDKEEAGESISQRQDVSEGLVAVGRF